MIMRITPKLPDGFAPGQRERTTETYAKVNPRAWRGEGTILKGSNGATGCAWIKLDGMKHPHQMHRNFFEAAP